MKPTRSRWLAVSLAVALAVPALWPGVFSPLAATASASARPRFGGTLRVEMQAALTTLNPADRPTGPFDASARSALSALVFDRLVEFDADGNLTPGLATGWQPDSTGTQWQLRLRRGVRFHDGAALSPTAVADSLNDYSNRSGGIWRASTFGDTVVIRADAPHPQLPYELATSACSITRQDFSGRLHGTGPFKIADWEPGVNLRLTANDDYWGSRPFLDAIEVKLGRPLREQGIALELGQADLVELSAEQVRALAQGAMRAWSSLPVQLMGLSFTQPALIDPRLRQALALSIDRAAIRDVLLQKQGEVARGILPQWMSGYEFALPGARDMEFARSLVSGLSQQQKSLVLSYDARDALAKSVAERVAVNAREVGLNVQVQARDALRLENVDVLLMRWNAVSHVLSEAPPAGADSKRSTWLHPFALGAAPQAYFQAEDALVKNLMIPIVHFPASYGLGPRVRNWAPSKWGAWRLADVWVDESAAPARTEEKP